MTPEQLVADLDAIARELADLSGVHQAAGDDVLDVVDPPRRTGRLADSVGLEANDAGFVLVAGGPTAPYGAIVHARNPFLTRALDTRREAVVDALVDHIRSAINH